MYILRLWLFEILLQPTWAKLPVFIIWESFPITRVTWLWVGLRDCERQVCEMWHLTQCYYAADLSYIKVSLVVACRPTSWLRAGNETFTGNCSVREYWSFGGVIFVYQCMWSLWCAITRVHDAWKTVCASSCWRYQWFATLNVSNRSLGATNVNEYVRRISHVHWWTLWFAADISI